MEQLEFSSMEAKEELETVIQDALLYCQTTASVGRCVLKEIKARGRSIMGAKAFVHILLSMADALEDYAQRVAESQEIARTYDAHENAQVLAKIEDYQHIGDGVA